MSWNTMPAFLCVSSPQTVIHFFFYYEESYFLLSSFVTKLTKVSQVSSGQSWDASIGCLTKNPVLNLNLGQWFSVLFITTKETRFFPNFILPKVGNLQWKAWQETNKRKVILFFRYWFGFARMKKSHFLTLTPSSLRIASIQFLPWKCLYMDPVAVLPDTLLAFQRWGCQTQ